MLGPAEGTHEPIKSGMRSKAILMVALIDSFDFNR